MYRFAFLLVLFLFFVQVSSAQTDSSAVSNAIPPIRKDSVVSWVIDSLWKKVNPWEYPPPCIVPPKWDTFSLRDFYPTLQFVLYTRYHAAGAKADLKATTAQILFPGGFSGIPDFSSEKDKQFQRKYGVEFFSQGCVHMGGPDEDEAAYNQVIFDYLDKKYGETWRYELRDDAIGFEAPGPIYNAADLVSSASILVANLEKPSGKSVNPEPENAVWWYVLPTSGFALLLSLYWIVKRKRK